MTTTTTKKNNLFLNTLPTSIVLEGLEVRLDVTIASKLPKGVDPALVADYINQHLEQVQEQLDIQLRDARTSSLYSEQSAVPSQFAMTEDRKKQVKASSTEMVYDVPF